MSTFLDNLKKAVDTGEFNSEAAKKINDIDKLADEKKNASDLVSDRLEKAGYAAPVSEEEALELNSKYEKEMARLKEIDQANGILATLIDMDDMIKASVVDVLDYLDEIDERLSVEFEKENPNFGELNQKIEHLRNKYKSIINN